MRFFPLKKVGIGADGFIVKRERTTSEKIKYVSFIIISLFMIWCLLFFVWCIFFGNRYSELDKNCELGLEETYRTGFDMMLCEYKVIYQKLILNYNQYILFTFQTIFSFVGLIKSLFSLFSLHNITIKN